MTLILNRYFKRKARKQEISQALKILKLRSHRLRQRALKRPLLAKGLCKKRVSGFRVQNSHVPTELLKFPQKFQGSMYNVRID